MDKKSLKEVLTEIVKDRSEEIYSLACEVIEIDEGKRTITADPINGNARLFDVRLQSEINGTTGLVIFPKKGSVVIVTFINKSIGFVSISTEVDKVLLNTEEVIINEGDNKGLVKVEPLTDKINALEKDVNQLKGLISSWVPVPTDGGAALKTVLSSWFSSQLTITLEGDIENDKVKH